MIFVKSGCWMIQNITVLTGRQKLTDPCESYQISDGSESRLGIDSTRHFLADSYSILLCESRLGLNQARLFKTRTGSDSIHHYYWWVQVKTQHRLNSYSILLDKSRLGLNWAQLFRTRTCSDSIFSDSTHHYTILWSKNMNNKQMYIFCKNRPKYLNFADVI